MLQQLAEKVSERINGEYGITVPWALIAELVIAFIEQCLKNREAFASTARHPTMLQRMAANVLIRRMTPYNRREDIVAIQNSMFSVGAETDDAELFSVSPKRREH